MITIRIAATEVPLEEVDASWINQQINRRRADGAAVCVQVSIAERDANLLLRTPTCGNGAGGGRPPNAREQRVIDLWNERGLNRTDFNGGSVVAFVRQLRNLL